MSATFVPAAARACRGGPPNWFWLAPPVLDTATGSYVWPGLDLGPSPGRGKGVFASQPLPAGLLVPYGGQEATPARVWWLGKHDKDRFVARTGRGCTSGVNADPTLQPPGHEFAWPGSRLNEASPGELYNCRFVWWPRVHDTRDQPAYPHAPPAQLRFYMELMVPVPAGAELLVSYEFRSRRSRKYDVAPPPPLSTPPEWGQHLGGAEARLLRLQRERAMRQMAKEAVRAVVAEEAKAVRLRKLARARVTLLHENVAKGRAKRDAATERAACMREKKLKRADVVQK